MLSTPRISGKFTELKTPILNDDEILKIIEYYQDQDFLPLIEKNPHALSMNTMKKYILDTEGSYCKKLFAVTVKGKNEIAGLCSLERKSPSSRSIRVDLLIGKPYINKGYGKEVLQLLTQFAFDEVGAHRVEAYVPAMNKKALHICEACGFKKCGTEHEVDWFLGSWHDNIILEVLEREYNKKNQEALKKMLEIYTDAYGDIEDE